jgi:hypothetical protein
MQRLSGSVLCLLIVSLVSIFSSLVEAREGLVLWLPFENLDNSVIDIIGNKHHKC